MVPDNERVGRDLSPRERFLALGWVVAGLLAVSSYMYVDYLHAQLAESRSSQPEITDAENAAERVVRRAIQRAEREQALAAGSGGVPDGSANETENEEQFREDDGE